MMDAKLRARLKALAKTAALGKKDDAGLACPALSTKTPDPQETPVKSPITGQA
jgi:hypothetical protein